MGIGEVLSLVGGVADAIGGGKNKGATEVSGFDSLKPDQKNFLSKDVFDRIKAYFGGSYRGLPMRSLNASDTDPIFGSPARQYMAEMLTRNATPAGTGTQTGGVDSATLDAVKAALMRNAGQSALTSGDYRSATGRLARDPSLADADLAKLFDSTGGSIESRGVMAGRGKNAPTSGQSSDINDLVRKFLMSRGA